MAIRQNKAEAWLKLESVIFEDHTQFRVGDPPNAVLCATVCQSLIRHLAEFDAQPRPGAFPDPGEW